MKRAERHVRSNTALTESGFFFDENSDCDDPTNLLLVAPPAVGSMPARPTPPPLPARPSRSKPAPGAVREPSELEVGKLFLENYLVERVVGSMGNCVVVKVRHARLGRRFLLKYLSPAASEKPYIVEEFLRGAREAMRLRSEHTARTADVGVLRSGLPYLITEAFHGSEVREILRVRGALGRAEAVDFVLQAAHAVAEAHRRGLTHGSLSPSTLFVTTGTDGLPVVKVLDFGSSPTLRGDPFAVKLRGWTQGTAIFWESMRLWDTLAYSAPEQLRSSVEVTSAVDVWALGAILYELLVGSPPFRGSSTTALMAAIVADSPAAPATVSPGLSRELEAIVLRCLSKSPEARFRSVAHLATALRAFASPEGRLIVERIARIEGHDPEQAAWSSSSPALVPARPSRTSSLANGGRAPTAKRSRIPRWLVPFLLATLGALGGVLAGTVVARVLAS